VTMTQRDPPHWRFIDRPTVKAQFQLELRDVWVGCFWRKTEIALHFYACLIPCLSLHVTILRKELRG
jgi:hypothetical protein